MSEIQALAPFDFHLHTGLSADGKGTVLEFCEQAARLGMKAVGFCEHLDLDPRDLSAAPHDYEQYRREITEARSRFGDRLAIRMGAEAGFVPRILPDIRDYLSEHQYDYVIGSVHAIADGTAGISEEYESLETFARREFNAVYEEYFETVCEMVVSGLFDVVGHLDLIQRFGVNHQDGPLQWGNYYGALRRILEGAIKREMALEINTSGLRQAPRAAYPDRYVLSLYRELGGRAIMVGSDAHAPDQLGAGIPAALHLAQDLRLTRLVCFKDRIPESISY